jgi:four helix bundle protein
MNRLPSKSFQDLIVWQKAHQLVLGIYNYTSAFPKTETYGLAPQMRRAAVSIPPTSLKASKSVARPIRLAS